MLRCNPSSVWGPPRAASDQGGTPYARVGLQMKAGRGYRSYGRQSFAALDGANLSLVPDPALVSGYQVVKCSF